MGDNSFSNAWLKENLVNSKKELNRVKNAYESLENKKTKYAHGILRLLQVREKIVKLWEEELKEENKT